MPVYEIGVAIKIHVTVLANQDAASRLPKVVIGQFPLRL